MSAVAVQHWAQQTDATLRAVIGLEHQFTNADSGGRQEVLVPEGIPAKGKMAGRDRLQVIFPISGRVQIGDGDLLKVLPAGASLYELIRIRPSNAGPSPISSIGRTSGS